MISCAPIITTRARTGRATRRTPLQGWTASELAKLPTYYVMDRDQTMAETVAAEMPSPDADRIVQVAAGQ